jgi:lipoic acid synthetase
VSLLVIGQRLLWLLLMCCCLLCLSALLGLLQVLEAFQQLRARGVDVVTLGQYMRPTKKHMAVSEFVTPAAFAAYQQAAEEMGFLYVASGPMVRSSYRAGELFLQHKLRNLNKQQTQGEQHSADPQ